MYTKKVEQIKNSRHITVINSMSSNDVEPVIHFLELLPFRYPGFTTWVNKRLTEVLQGSAYSYVAKMDGDIIGVIIGIPKAHNRFKISTLLIHPGYQGWKLGTVLLNLMLAKARTSCASEVYITADSSLDDTLGVFLEKKGFRFIQAFPDRYEKGRTENSYALVRPNY